jgi:hypothetical protein
MEPVADRKSYYPKEFALPSAELRYGYMWWGICRGEGDCDFAAEGNLGQTIYVSPRSKLIMVKNARATRPHWHQWDDPFSRVADALAI